MPGAPSGLFITFEGGEGAGKTTQCRLLSNRLKALGYETVLTREPGGTPAAEKLRSLLLDPDVDLGPMEQVLMFYAARRNHLDYVIRPALENGAIVICDRFSDSTAAYQGAAGGADYGSIAEIDRIALEGFAPDITFLLDLSVESGAERVRIRGEATDRFEQAPDSFHQRLRQAFLEIARNAPERVKVLDATQSENMVHDAIFELLSDLLPVVEGNA